MKGNTEIVSGPVARDCVAKALEGLGLELIAEAYHVLKAAIRVSHDEMRTVFADWNRGELQDPLIARAADVLGLRDEEGDPLLEKVLDLPRGAELCRDAVALALDLGVPAPLIAQTAFSASLASQKDHRVDASALLNGPKSAPTGERHAMIEELRKAVLAAFILSYAECYFLLAASGEKRESAFASLAAQGSAVAARSLEALGRSGPKDSIILDAKLKSFLDPNLASLRRVCQRCVEGGLHAPTLLAAVAFYDGYRSPWLPANLVVALRDSLEASGYERVDRPRGESFHSEWK
jgi:6-phosphogluconate dehydrogenase